MTRSETKTILAHLEATKDNMLDFLKALVLIETPSQQAEAQLPLIQQVSQQLQHDGMFCMHIPGKRSGGMLFSRRRARQKNHPLQLLIGHTDTIWPLGTLSTMPAEELEGKLYGPGVFDMKAGLTQIAFALSTINHLQIPLAVEPMVLINSDEETGSRESTTWIRRLARIATRTFVLEPPIGPTGKLKTARKGLSRLTMRIKGKAAHAGLNPEEGISAIEELSFQVQKLFALNDPSRGISVNVGMIQGGISANVIAPESSAVIDIRTLTKKDALSVIEKISSFQPRNAGIELQVDGELGRLPMEANERNQRLWSLAAESATLLNLKLEGGTAGGGSDGNTTSQFTATLDGLGTVGGVAHALDEHILVDKLVERTALLILLLASPDIST